jgi:hypothetical protein
MGVVKVVEVVEKVEEVLEEEGGLGMGLGALVEEKVVAWEEMGELVEEKRIPGLGRKEQSLKWCQDHQK